MTLPLRRVPPSTARQGHGTVAPADEQIIDIPIARHTRAERAREAHFGKGRHLARQDRWDILSKMIRTADRRRLITSDGTPVAELLARGACADAMDAVRDAVALGDVVAARAPLRALEEAMGDEAPDLALTLVLALAHIDASGAWCSKGGLPPVHQDHHEAYANHLASAAILIKPHLGQEADAPLLAYLRTRLLALELRPKERVIGEYEALILLAPDCHRNLRAFGRDLLPRRFGGFDVLDTQARRMAKLTSETWGDGGYVWMYHDALGHDIGAVRWIDADLFLSGMNDILERTQSQHVVNLMAALTGLTLPVRWDRRRSRARISDAFGIIVRDHLREIHPLVWDAAPQPGVDTDDAPGPDQRLAHGKRRAILALEHLFAQEIEAGHRIVFADKGVQCVPARPLAPEGALG